MNPDGARDSAGGASRYDRARSTTTQERNAAVPAYVTSSTGNARLCFGMRENAGRGENMVTERNSHFVSGKAAAIVLAFASLTAAPLLRPIRSHRQKFNWSAYRALIRWMHRLLIWQNTVTRSRGIMPAELQIGIASRTRWIPQPLLTAGILTRPGSWFAGRPIQSASMESWWLSGTTYRRDRTLISAGEDRMTTSCAKATHGWASLPSESASSN